MCSSMKLIKCLIVPITLLLGACGDESVQAVVSASKATASALVEVTEPSADLLVTESLLAERVLEPNQVVRVDATVANQGGAGATKSQLRYLLSRWCLGWG